MSVLVLGLYAEGPTDHDFLPPVIRRTAERLLAGYGRGEVETDVRVVQLFSEQRRDRGESIVHAARYAVGYHALIVHADADEPNSQRAWDERYYPGYLLVQQVNERICKQLLPIIPIQTIEAWLLADYRALLEEIGTDMRARDLGIPERPRQVEGISRPKERLKQAVRIANDERSRRHRSTDISFLYEPMGNNISLEKLGNVPSYQKFEEDLTKTLIDINIIPRNR